MLKFKVEQLAIVPPDPAAAKELLTAMGATELWAEDHVVAHGEVFGDPGSNEANLSFDYDLLGEAKEFEVLQYTRGPNWMQDYEHSASHIGMHVTAGELMQWRSFFTERGIHVAQEVVTVSHTNPVIAGKRQYNYVIFNTRPILGIDVKFIVRLDVK